MIAMLLPLSHDKMVVRRIPFVTVLIIGITIAIHVVLGSAKAHAEERFDAALANLEALVRENPALGRCPNLDGRHSRAGSTTQVGSDASSAEPTEYETACRELEEALASHPERQFGFIPAHQNWRALVTANFLHADVWHLLGNMWFLFLCGLALEDRWGRLVFPGYYLASGVVAMFAQYLAVPTSSLPVIGASGAVAGAMGAFLVLFAKTKIRFVALLAFKPFSFRAPAYLMLPLWVVVEAVSGLVTKTSDTAHWAHVGGFVFGVLSAVLFRVVGIDRDLDDAVERAAVLGNDPRIEAAELLVKKGDAEQAVLLLQGLAKEKPESFHVWQALISAATASGDRVVRADAERALETLYRAKGRKEDASSIRSEAFAASARSSVRSSVPSGRAAAEAPSVSGDPPYFPKV
jgi:membrane associated rhomboid family serine protease